MVAEMMRLSAHAVVERHRSPQYSGSSTSGFGVISAEGGIQRRQRRNVCAHSASDPLSLVHYSTRWVLRGRLIAIEELACRGLPQ